MSKSIVNVTKSAFTKMANIMMKSKNERGFLLGVSSGGCNGFNFKLNLITEQQMSEVTQNKASVIVDDKVNVYIDPISEIHLFGTTIDYVQENYEKGIFESKFTYNIDKKIATSCGCGVSFMPRNISNK